MDHPNMGAKYRWGTLESAILGRPFVKRFALCYRTVVCLFRLSVCLSVLYVTLVYRGQMVGWIKMKLGKEVGLCPGYIVLDRDRALPPPKKGGGQFSADLYCTCSLFFCHGKSVVASVVLVRPTIAASLSH